ncbi:AAA family ATPase [Aestuariirhabdus sp. Z084]|uniref:AAA family ATPase n=1 Tax=Aestuariirhabdus haliotis TaxID=2918751 RepID=UPI00201B4004|nr:AAA family ATPase [Aestuariirhabdus haliotis]MCL6415829.1 AAA family ATPase [Aestuariirhabdus haliotis]MCL6419869.1 AAA family ATPase [Aestuariirhabdus haliotis]
MSDALNAPIYPDSELYRGLLALRQDERISPLAWHFANFLGELETEADDTLLLASVLLNHELAKGNVCIDLRSIANDCGLPLSSWPAVDIWRDNLACLSVVYCVQGGWQQALDADPIQQPLVLDGYRLYLNRYWYYECALASDLCQRAGASVDIDAELLQSSLQRLFGQSQPGLDWQQVAAALSASHRFSVISGGPGTGKTTTVTKLLLAISEQYFVNEGREPRIRLAAPTGKAAARLNESIKQAKARLRVLPELTELSELLSAIPEEAVTLHRLLGWQGHGGRFRYGRDNPLLIDLLVLDEASMVDLPMMSHLLEALPDDARLILLGDRDQLASVEAGSVLGDICGEGLPAYDAEQWSQLASLCGQPELAKRSSNTPHFKAGPSIASDDPDTNMEPLSQQQLSLELSVADPESKTFGSAHNTTSIHNSIALLRHSYRFSDNSGIGCLAQAVNDGNATTARQLLTQPPDDLERFAISRQGYQAMLARAVEGYRSYLQPLVDAVSNPNVEHDPASVLAAFSGFQLLCALQQGDYGAEGLNERIEQALRQQGLIRDDGLWYPGRPIMITRNDYGMRLFNGDIGVAMPDPHRGGEIRVCFEGALGALRWITPGRLPQHSTVFAMTVHKSQGSEFDHPLLVLPPEHSPLISRELLYTGITRARKQLGLLISDEVLERALRTRTHRVSGLAERLWGTV